MGGFAVPCVVWTAFVAMASFAMADDLRGVVRDEAGKPIAGALVSISTAGPKVGTATLCPSCYLDCAKFAITDESGHYLIQDLNPSLRFSVVAAALGRPPEIAKQVDPSAGGLDFRMTSRPADLPESQLLTLRVVDEAGQPVERAIATFSIASRKQRTTDVPASNTYEKIAISGPDGVMIVAIGENIEGLNGTLSGRGFASRRVLMGDWSRFRNLRDLTTLPEQGDDGIPFIVMDRGATIRGKVERDGQPLAGVAVQLLDRDQSSASFMGWHDIATDEQGHYLFSNVPVGREWEVYVRMGTVGVSARKMIRQTEDGALIDVPPLRVEEGVRIAGRVVLSDGQPIPPGTQLGLYRKDTWDSVSIELPPDGRFSFEQIVRQETVSLSLKVPGYRPVATEPGSTWEAGMWSGLPDDQCAELELLLEPGTLPKRDVVDIETGNRKTARGQLPLSRLSKKELRSEKEGHH